MDTNTITVFGIVGKDPELRQTPSGEGICSFSIANSSWKKKGSEWDQETSWFDCSIWGDQAKRFVERTKAKHRVVVTGSMRQRTWEDKDGNKQERWGVQVRNVQFLEKKPKTEQTEVVEERDSVPF